ncbi:HlyD family efflux transporter periplasmic adaptor subunit, partial [Candidatus Riflebacteria bacterium]
MLKKFIWLLNLSILLFSISGCSLKKSSHPAGAWLPLEYSEVQPEFKFRGLIESQESITMNPEISGTITWMVEEGSFVKQGAPVIRLEQKEFIENVENTQLQFDEAQLLLKKARLEHELKLVSRKRKVKIANLKKEFAEIELQQFLKSGDYPRYVELKLRDKLLKKEILQIKEDIKEKKLLRKRGFISESDIFELEVKLKNKLNELTKNGLALKLLFYKDPIRRIDLEGKLNSAKSKYSRIEKKLNLEEKSLALKKEKLQQEVESIKKNLEVVEGKLAKTTIRAPISGVFFPLKTWVTEGQMETVKVGNRAWDGWEIAKVSDLKKLQLVFYVNEIDISLFSTGQTLDFFLDGQPQKKYHAKIFEISQLGELAKNELNPLAKIKIIAHIQTPDTSISLGRSANIVFKQKIISGWKIPANCLLDDGKILLKHQGKIRADILEARGRYLYLKNSLRKTDFIFKEDRVSEKKVTVQKKKIANKIKDIGELVPSKQSFITVPFSGKIEFLLPEGTQVKKGTHIATLDTKDLEKKLMTVELEIKSLKNEEKSVLLEKANFEEKEKSDLEAVRFNFKITRVERDITNKPLNPLELKLQKIAENIVIGDIKQISHEVKEKKSLEKKGYISSQEIELLNLKLEDIQINEAKL